MVRTGQVRAGGIRALLQACQQPGALFGDGLVALDWRLFFAELAVEQGNRRMRAPIQFIMIVDRIGRDARA
jgi:hypothetical protein